MLTGLQPCRILIGVRRTASQINGRNTHRDLILEAALNTNTRAVVTSNSSRAARVLAHADVRDELLGASGIANARPDGREHYRFEDFSAVLIWRAADHSVVRIQRGYVQCFCAQGPDGHDTECEAGYARSADWTTLQIGRDNREDWEPLLEAEPLAQRELLPYCRAFAAQGGDLELWRTFGEQFPFVGVAGGRLTSNGSAIVVSDDGRALYGYWNRATQVAEIHDWPTDRWPVGPVDYHAVTGELRVVPDERTA